MLKSQNGYSQILASVQGGWSLWVLFTVKGDSQVTLKQLLNSVNCPGVL